MNLAQADQVLDRGDDSSYPGLWLIKKPGLELKELISRNRYKTKTKPYFCDHFYSKT